MNPADIAAVKDKVEKFIAKYPIVDGPLTQIANQVKFDKGYIALAIISLPILVVFASGGGAIIIDLVSYLYPVYASIKAIESSTSDDDTLWLTYWIVFCFFKIVESAADFLVSFIPFYFIGKLAFLVWCYHPSSKGSLVIYNTIIKPHINPALGIASGKKSE